MNIHIFLTLSRHYMIETGDNYEQNETVKKIQKPILICLHNINFSITFVLECYVYKNNNSDFSCYLRMFQRVKSSSLFICYDLILFSVQVSELIAKIKEMKRCI